MATENQSFFDKANNWIKNSITIKVVTILILILFLLIPVSMIKDLIYERENRQAEAILEVSSKWGNQQTITGIVLNIPYWKLTKQYEEGSSEKAKWIQTKEYAHFLPENLLIDSKVNPELRYRGIYEIIVYSSEVKLKGNFRYPSFDEWKIDAENILWDEATISLGLSDLRGIQKNTNLIWDKTQYSFNPGIESNDVIANGISTKVNVQKKDSNQVFEFDLNLQFNGSSRLSFVPLGKQTEVHVSSPWKNPSFDGAFLPDSREITDNGFNAMWNVLHLNRAYPQSFLGATQGINESAFGINLIVPLDEYQKSMRSAKYAVMFITLTFLIFFFIQILNKTSIHPIQYIIVGLSLCVFYTLLIALSEHIPFAISYLISSFSVINLIGLYAKSIFKNTKLTLIVYSILTLLYIFIYTIIQLQDYALLMGSIGLFIILSIIMYLSKKINWYSIPSNGNDV